MATLPDWLLLAFIILVSVIFGFAVGATVGVWATLRSLGQDGVDIEFDEVKRQFKTPEVKDAQDS